MKRLILMAVAILFAVANVFAVPAHHDKMTAHTTKKAKSAKNVYTCPMHPDVIAYKSGKCPKPNCGMSLVQKTDIKRKSSVKM